MMSPTTSAIWAGMEPQRLGPFQQRGQAAMGVVTMKGGRYEHVPIRNYGPRPRDPQPQELPPRPQSQQVEETQSDGSFELVMELVDEEASAAGRQAQSTGYAAMVKMAMTLPGRDRRAPERDHGSEPPQEEDEDEDEEDHPLRICTTVGFNRQRMQSQGSARPPGYWHRGRGQGTKVDTATGEEANLWEGFAPRGSSFRATKVARAPRSRHQP